MEKMPFCVTCKFWSPYYKQTISGWCTQHQIVAESDHWCERHKPVITTKSTTMTPISETVQAAIYYAEFTESTILEYRWACDKLELLTTDQDRLRVSPQLAAAARILAEEVERLRGELNNN
jgi:hypothetical protein